MSKAVWKIGVLGSGQVGAVLANGFRGKGHEVMRGSREPGKLADWQKETQGKTGTFDEAAKWAEIVVLAVKGSAAEGLCEQLRDALAGKIVLDATNPIANAPPQNGVIRYFTTLDESLMERLQKKAPAARFVKCFNSVGNGTMIDPQLPGGPPTMFICGNDEAAKAETQKLLAQVGWETADMGGVEGARAIEPLCMLWCIPAFRGQGRNHAFKLLRG